MKVCVAFTPFLFKYKGVFSAETVTTQTSCHAALRFAWIHISSNWCCYISFSLYLIIHYIYIASLQPPSKSSSGLCGFLFQGFIFTALFKFSMQYSLHHGDSHDAMSISSSLIYFSSSLCVYTSRCI